MHSVFLLVNLIDNFVVSTMVRLDLTHSLFSFIPLSPLPLPITFTIGNCQLTELWLDHFIYTSLHTISHFRFHIHKYLHIYSHTHIRTLIYLSTSYIPYVIPHTACVRAPPL